MEMTLTLENGIPILHPHGKLRKAHLKMGGEPPEVVSVYPR